MKIEYLTPEDQLLLDPYGNCRRHVASWPEKPTFAKPSSFYRVSPEQVKLRLKQIEAQYASDKHRPYFQYEDEMWSKFGPQGGNPPRSMLFDSLKSYYEHADASRSFMPALRLGRDFLIRRIKQVIADYGYPQMFTSTPLNTAAGSPTGMHKGDYLAETLGAKPFRHAYPALVGYRRMRNKDRLIFMDSVLNVRYVEQQLNAVRLWLKTHFPEYFSAWCNPEIRQNFILTDAIKHRDTFIETDYVKMDQHFSLELVQEMIFPLYEVLIPNSFLSFASMIEELFHQPVYMGDFLIVGLHNMFSGIGPTNDFETIYTVELMIGTALQLHCYDQMSLVALGDDCSVALRGRKAALARKFLDSVIETSNQADMIIHADEKSRIVVGETRFCRKVYYPSCHQDINGNLAGNYPLNLAANNIIQPERPSSRPGVAAVADLQRMDNCFGSPGWTDLVQFFYKNSLHKFAVELDLDSSPIDWWFRLYGEKWNPESSPSFHLIRKIKS